MAARDSNGYYTFTPDVYAGDVLKPGITYNWRVTMLNAKYKDYAWSTENPTFYVATSAASEA